MSKGDNLRSLLDCMDRLDRRFQVHWDRYLSGDYAAQESLDRVHRASQRVTSKIAALLIQAVSGKLTVTYELTETGKQAVLELDSSIANGIFPTLADMQAAQAAVRAFMIEGKA